MHYRAAVWASFLFLIGQTLAQPAWAQSFGTRDHPSSNFGSGQATVTSPSTTTVTTGTTAAWVSGGWTYLRDTLPAIAYHGNSYNSAVGADIQANDRLILGAALSGEDTELVTTFNSGHLNTTGYGINPYAVYTFTDNFYADALFGFSWLGNDLDRSSGKVVANYDSFRWLANLDLNGRFTDGPWQYMPVIGYLYVHQNDDAYTERGVGATTVSSQTTIISQGRLGGKIGYAIDNWTPYVGARWEHDFIQPAVTIAPGVAGGSPSNSREDAFVQVGVNATFGTAMSGGLEFNTTQKADQQSYGLLANFRYTF